MGFLFFLFKDSAEGIIFENFSKSLDGEFFSIFFSYNFSPSFRRFIIVFDIHGFKPNIFSLYSSIKYKLFFNSVFNS